VPTDDDPLHAVTEALATLGDRWSLAVIAALLDGPLRFGELQERLGAIASNILSARLRALESGGLLVAVPYSDRPARFEYRLTTDGERLVDPIRLLAEWATARGGRGPVHAVCGTPLEVRWWCPTCAEIAEPSEDEAIRA
jgi:DNA-binding HxlR family transcriptional regulator